MPTIKPRITVTLKEHTHAVLKTISESSGQPISTFIAEMLDSAIPTLERMAVTFKTIKAAQEAERSRFLNSVDSAQAALEPVVAQTLGQFDLFLGAIETAVAGRGDPARGEGLHAAADLAPPTNRGDTPTRAKQRKPSAGKALKAVGARAVSKKTNG